jgi:hypothetical protein
MMLDLLAQESDVFPPDRRSGGGQVEQFLPARDIQEPEAELV